MTASPWLRPRNAILAAALALLALALMTTVAINAANQLSAGFSAACHRILPQPPALPRPGPWRIAACFARPSGH